MLQIPIYRAVSIHAVGNGFIRSEQHFFTECMNAFPTMLFFKFQFNALFQICDAPSFFLCHLERSEAESKDPFLKRVAMTAHFQGERISPLAMLGRNDSGYR